MRDQQICTRKDAECSDSQPSRVTVKQAEAAHDVLRAMVCPKKNRYIDAVLAAITSRAS